ncbi:MAG: preprotein translocase subunit SecY [Acidilobaceae archaeon]
MLEVMVDFIGVLAGIAERLPSVSKPAPRPTLYRRLMFTGIVLVIYFIMANIPLYGIPKQDVTAEFTLLRIIFASSAGSLMELGIGPIVTAGLILQVLVGARIISIDLTKPDDRRKFTGAQKTLSILFAFFEASAFVLGKRYWIGTGETPTYTIMAIVILQLTFGAVLVIYFDELIQKGWGIGSAVSLFILAGVAQGVIWSFLGYIPGIVAYGLIPALIIERSAILLARPNAFPDITGALATISMILLLAYLQAMRVEIPVASPRFRGIRSRIPLQFIYVTNIPILLVGILVADLQLVQGILRDFLGPTHNVYQLYSTALYYITPPRGIIETSLDPLRALTFAISWTIMAIVFGLLWVEIAGLNPREQAEKLVKSGLEIPGFRRSPKSVEVELSQYIYPLALLSSILVAVIVIVADIFGAYGTGTGLLLAVGIVNQYYALILRERALEAYPLIKRILGEE